MATVEQVVDLLAEQGEVITGSRRGSTTWFRGSVAVAWERPFSKADLRRYGDESPPSGPILAVRTGDLDEKQVLLSRGIPGVFTIPHFDGYNAVLVQLDVVSHSDLRELVEDAWDSAES